MLAALAAGVLARHYLAPGLAVLGALVLAVVAVLAVDHTLRRTSLALSDRRAVLAGAVLTAVLAVVAATGALNVVVLAVAAVVVVVATRRLLRPTAAALREAVLAQKAADWGEVARVIGHPEVQLNGPLLDRPTGYTYRVRVPAGSTIDFLRRLTPEITSALGLRRGQVTVELDKDWNREAYIHVREADPTAQAAEEIRAPHINSATDPLLTFLYDDGSPLHLRLFIDGFGGKDTVVCSAKGGGKTSIVIRILKLLSRARLQNVAIWMADGAQGRDFGGWVDCFDRYTTSPAGLLVMAQAYEAEVNRRERELAKRPYRVWRPTHEEPALLFVIEETEHFADSPEGPEIARILARAIMKSRAAMAGLLLLTKYPHQKNVFGAAVRKELANRVCGRTNERDTMILNSRQATEEIPETAQGTVYAETYGEKRAVRARAIWTDDDERPLIVESWKGRVARGVAAEAFEEISRRQTEARERAAARAESRRPVPTDLEAPAAPEKATVLPARIELVSVGEPERKNPEIDPMAANETYKALLRNAFPGGVTMKEVMNATGLRRGWVRTHLVNPSTDAGWVDVDRGQREHTYRLTAPPEREAVSA